MFAALGRLMWRWRWPVLGGWLVLVLAGAVLGGQVFDRLGATDNLRADAESQRTERRVKELLPEGSTVVAVVRDREIYDPPLVESVTRITNEIRDLPGVIEVDDVYNSAGGQIGADNSSSLVVVELADELPDAERERLEDRVVTLLRGIDAPEVLVGGEKLAERAFADQAIRDATIGESIALVVLLVALVVILGGFVAGVIPLAAALGAVAVTLLGLLGLATVMQVSEFAVNVVTLLGIGLAVDYALLLIARFREERAADPDAPPAELLARTTATAGRAVLVSGLAVGAAMVGLFAFAEPLLAAMALGGALVVVLATLVGLTAVPALIAVAHRRIPVSGADNRINRTVAAVTAPLRRLTGRRTPGAGRRGGPAAPTTDGLLARLAGYAQRRPKPVAIGVSVLLLLLAAPFVFGANLANSDARALPASMEARQVHDVVLRDFQAGRAAPVVVVVETDPATAAVRDLLNQLNTMPNVIRMQPRPDVPGNAAVIDVTPEGETGGPQSREVVRAIRDLDAPFPILVGGPAAELVDYQSSVTSRLPLAVLVLLLATAVLLFALTGSVVIPVKALLMNVLTLLATLGLLVVVFQWGIGAPLIGVESWGAIDLTTPILLFVFIFGLTMDYEVFLLGRIREEWTRWSGRHTPEARAKASDRAVLDGIRHTGPVVTAAAVCITIVFLGFLLGELTAVKEIGFGMAVAVILDVTVVRGLLLPALMSLLGEWNWWAPAPLRRLHERLFADRTVTPAVALAGSGGDRKVAVGRATAPSPAGPAAPGSAGAEHVDGARTTTGETVKR
ncbi:MMPL family transporter [Polymorphospora rubra]|uniref:Putative conserved membrane protein, MmpL family n=1 Tax=Polymorphospora rubra TaxID=338584 RepID=A0A810N182_9ACTN|nr:MMPL family transporter [Polymorphospora rubra]BCJ65438.1 putative conserved membrane protein, MmpL family [Polymorphospora rubra]